jgi:hypothetical protein
VHGKNKELLIADGNQRIDLGNSTGWNTHGGTTTGVRQGLATGGLRTLKTKPPTQRCGSNRSSNWR